MCQKHCKVSFFCQVKLPRISISNRVKYKTNLTILKQFSANNITLIFKVKGILKYFKLQFKIYRDVKPHQFFPDNNLLNRLSK